MARAIKVVLFNPDRTASVLYINRKNMIGSSAFKLPKTDEVYMIDPDYSMYTITRRMMLPFKYVTYYFKRNIPKPVAMNKITGGESLGELKDNQLIIMKPVEVPKFSGWDYTGITAKELAALFNPQFYLMIARANKDKRADMVYYIQVGTLAGVAFIIYYMMQMLPKALSKVIP